MADIRSLFGVKLTRDDTTTASYMFAQIGATIVNVDTNTGTSLNINQPYSNLWSQNYQLYTGDLGTSDSNFTVFNDYLFHVNDRGPMATLDLQDPDPSWLSENIFPTPFARFIKPYRNRAYIAYTRFLNTADPDPFGQRNEVYLQFNPTFKSRVFYSNYPEQRFISWGVGFGLVNNVNAGATRVTVQQAHPGAYYFKSNRIRIGDPIFILHSGLDSGGWRQYTVADVESEYALKLTTPLEANTAGPFWVGGNWFDVSPDDGDFITGLEENRDLNVLLIFKRNSLHMYNESSLKQVSSIGTTSSKSIKTLAGLTFYFHGSDKERTGFYFFNGTREQKVSIKVQPFIDAMMTSNYDKVVAWTEGTKYRAFIGNLSSTPSRNNAFDISMTNAVFTYDLQNGSQSIDPIADVIRSSTSFYEDGVLNTYLGNDTNEVLKLGTSSSFNGEDINMRVTTGPVFPRGSQVVNEFTRIQIISRDASNVMVRYRLWFNPYDVDQSWIDLGTIKTDRTEITIPKTNSEAVGIDLEFIEGSQNTNTPVIEQVTIYSRPVRTITPEVKQL